MMEPQLKDMQAARRAFEGVIHPSPVIPSAYFSQILGSEIFLKLENLQETGSFKVRGAYNRLRHLGPEERAKGVIAASAGNHAQGVAWASKRLSIRAVIVMPEDVSLRKLIAVKEYGAEIILYGKHYSDAFNRALDLARERELVLIPGFDDPFVISGQGTIGLELEPLLTPGTAIVVPVGGGGLISGIATAAKSIQPDVRVVGVQTKSCPSTIRSLEQGRPVEVEVGPTLADGIAVNRPGSLTFPIIQSRVDEVIEVEEESIAGAVLSLLDKANIVAEGSGATPLAALMDANMATRAKRHILVISGGNIEINMIDRILQRGSIKMGRLIRIEVNLLDVPGSLWDLLGVIAKEKANILHILHDRLDPNNPIEVSRVRLNLETRGHDHAKEVVAEIEKAGYHVRQIN